MSEISKTCAKCIHCITFVTLQKQYILRCKITGRETGERDTCMEWRRREEMEYLYEAQNKFNFGTKRY